MESIQHLRRPYPPSSPDAGEKAPSFMERLRGALAKTKQVLTELTNTLQFAAQGNSAQVTVSIQKQSISDVLQELSNLGLGGGAGGQPGGGMPGGMGPGGGMPGGGGMGPGGGKGGGGKGGGRKKGGGLN